LWCKSLFLAGQEKKKFRFLLLRSELSSVLGRMTRLLDEDTPVFDSHVSDFEFLFVLLFSYRMKGSGFLICCRIFIVGFQFAHQVYGEMCMKSKVVCWFDFGTHSLARDFAGIKCSSVVILGHLIQF
jgi:hypothetical protein